MKTILLIIIILLAGCNGCKQPDNKPSTLEGIEEKYNPSIDSLKNQNKMLSDSIKSLITELSKQKQITTQAETTAKNTAKKLQEALNKKDTTQVLVYADEIIEEFENYVVNTNKQDSLQESVIEKQAATIINNRAEIELHESKYNLLKQAYQVQEINFNNAVKENGRLEKKLKRSKFWNKVLGIGTATGAALAGLIFLK
jgi:hypothetical protein